MTQLQISHATGYLRYSEFYAALSRHLLPVERPRILIFGCSTGEELLTVRQFWPNAEIYGCDVVDGVLDAARQKAPFARIFRSSKEAIRDLGEFDLVCANSVLCRHPFPGAEAYVMEFPFGTFVEFVRLLVQAVSAGRFLFAYNTNYFLDDVDIHAELAPIAIAGCWNNGFVPHVDRSGRLVARPVNIGGQLDRYHLVGIIDPIERMTAAIYQRTQGRYRVINDGAFAQDLAGLVPGPIAIPAGVQAGVFRPYSYDAANRNTILRTTLLHDPTRAAWKFHGVSIIQKTEP